MFKSSQILRSLCSRLSKSQSNAAVVFRGVHSDASKQSSEKPKELVAQWEIVKLGSENGFLSWSRNGYFCSVIAMTLSAQEGSLCDQLAIMALLLASYNMTMGTVGYIYNLHLQKAFVGTRRSSALLYSSAAVCHLLLWATVFAIYVGYEVVDDEEIEQSDK